MEWWVRGDKPAYISEKRGHFVYYKINKLHRDNGLVLIMKGVREVWYKNGKIHNGYENPAHINVITLLDITCPTIMQIDDEVTYHDQSQFSIKKNKRRISHSFYRWGLLYSIS